MARLTIGPSRAGLTEVQRQQVTESFARYVDCLMRQNGEAYPISDIYLDGAISEVATRRSEFATILRNEGIDGLITALNRKADILTGTTAKSL